MTQPLEPGQVITGSIFNEPMQVETIRENGVSSWTLGLVGVESERFRRVTLTQEDIENLNILESTFSYKGDGRILRLSGFARHCLNR